MDYMLLKRVIAALEARRVRYAVFGAIALNVHGHARITEDLDVFIAPTADNVERLKAALNDVFDDRHTDEISAEDLLGDYPSVRYVPPEGDVYFDILTRLGDAFAFDDLETERKTLDGVPLTVVTARTLYRMKKDTVRLKDRADAELLRQRFNLEPE
jgi:hypothetical protein